MGADTPAGGGETKPVIKNDKPQSYNRGNNNAQRRDYIKKEKFLGADPDLRGYVFEAKGTRAQQIANFERVDTIIKNQIGKEYHILVLQSIEDGALKLSPEPSPVFIIEDGKVTDKMTRTEEMKFKEKFSRHLSLTEKVETQLKQCYFKYFGQCDDDMKSSMSEDAGYEQANKDKDVIAIRKIIKTANFDYRRSEEPFKTLFTATREFMNMYQNDTPTVEYYKKFEDMKNMLDEMSGTGNYIYNNQAIVQILCTEDNVDASSIDSTQLKAYMKKGQERMLAMHFIMNCDKKRYGDIVLKFDQEYLSGINKYPDKLHDAYTLVKNWHQTEKKKGKGDRPAVPHKLGLSFNTYWPKCPNVAYVRT